jgi:hypothetical protein
MSVGCPNSNIRMCVLKSSRASPTVEDSIPTVSREFAYTITPHRDKSPYDGLNPTVPVYAAGSRTDPPVSVPSALYNVSILTAVPPHANIRPALSRRNNYSTTTRTASSADNIPVQILIQNISKMRVR